MPEDKQRHVKNTGAGAHRGGTLRNAIKPHKRTAEPDIKRAIADYTSGIRAGSVSQTYWGATVDKNAAALRANFGLSSDDEPYLLLDASGGKGNAGMLLSRTGVHLSDGRKGRASISWGDFATASIGIQRGMLVIGQNGIVSNDAQVVLGLLQQLQATISK